MVTRLSAAASKRGRGPGGGEELIEGVDRHELNAGDFVDSCRGETMLADGFHHAVGAVVAVVIRVFE